MEAQPGALLTHTAHPGPPQRDQDHKGSPRPPLGFAWTRTQPCTQEESSARLAGVPAPPSCGWTAPLPAEVAMMKNEEKEVKLI